jgi:hypothetical protein
MDVGQLRGRGQERELMASSDKNPEVPGEAIMGVVLRT